MCGISLWTACQPIVIGTPGSAEVDAASVGGALGRAGTGAGQQGGESAVVYVESSGGASSEGPCTEGPLTLEGLVSSERGAPVIGARVELGTEPPLFAVTDREGRYRFEQLCRGSYRVTPICVAPSVDVELTGDTVQDFSGNPGSAGSCDSSVIEPRVLLVIYDPSMSGVAEAPQRLSAMLEVDPPDALAHQVLDELSAATNGHVHPQTVPAISLADFPPLLGGGSYSPAEYAKCLKGEQACLTAAADFSSITSQHELCSVAQERRVDQIWLLGGDHFGFEALQQLECQPRAETQEPIRTVDVLGLSYAAGLSGVMAQYQGYADRALLQVFGESATKSNRYAPFRQALSEHALPGCEVCADDELAFSRFWLSRLPRERWLDAQGRYNDFWRYLVRPQDRLPREPISVTCSSSWLPGWCEHVTDEIQGECNSNEWATLDEATGWVEFSFEPPVLLSGLQLYDRACDEQVLSGHIELSDGSEDILFGELEQSGTEFTSINFDPKTVSGLRVVIDIGTGGSPGFGEIMLIAQP